MKNFIFLLLALAAAEPAVAQTLTVDSPIPDDLYNRTYLPSNAVAGVRKNMEKVVGYFAFVNKDGTISITGNRPASAKSSELARVQITGDKPSYESVVSKTSEINAALPMIGLTLNSNQRAQVTIIETAQFTSVSDPDQKDWQNLPAPSNGGHWAYVSSATISTVQITKMDEKGGGIDGLLQVLKIGGKTYQAKSVASNNLAVALFLVPDPVWIATGGSSAASQQANTKSVVAPALTLSEKPLNSLATQH